MIKQTKNKWVTFFSSMVIGFLIGISAIGGYMIRPYINKQTAKYPEAVQFVIDNPVYAEKIFNAHKQYMSTAEKVMQEQLDTLSGGKTDTLTPVGK